MGYNIAIIGGGGAGMMTAYLLNKSGHQVTVYEKQSELGGHIRTTNKNLNVEGLDPDLNLEGGVIEFPDNFKNFTKILDELGIQRHYLELGTCTFHQDGSHIISPLIIKRNARGWRMVLDYFKYYWLLISAIPLFVKIKRKKHIDIVNRTLDEVLESKSMAAQWVKKLTMYSYSMVYRVIGDFPAEIAVPAMGDYMRAEWYRIEGGVYSYIQKILDSFNGEIRCNVSVESVRRIDSGIEISIGDNTEIFDKVVFATPPDQVLTLLADPTAEEKVLFENWGKNIAETVIHSDISFYDDYDLKYPSEFDFFEHNGGWGYNAFLNYLCEVSPETPYFLAFDMDEFIDPRKVIDRLEHHTPCYTVKAMESRNQIISNNGRCNTYYAGAYLGDGLHEGAATSAYRVSDLINQNG